MDAVKTNKIKILKKLLELGAPIEDDPKLRGLRAADRKQPLHRAAIEGHVGCIKLLAGLGPKLNTPTTNHHRNPNPDHNPDVEART